MCAVESAYVKLTTSRLIRALRALGQFVSRAFKRIAARSFIANAQLTNRPLTKRYAYIDSEEI